MKGSNIKRKMGRLTYSACALFFAGGMLVSCEDELLTGMPSWLGSSIYEELEKRGNYQTMLQLINDDEVSNINATTGQTENARMLSLTGSKTLFVANDEAFARFFANNKWGVKSYDDLSASQKKLLFNSAMINSAYLIELMSSAAGDEPATGTVMRRNTSVTLYDSVPYLGQADMPDNEYWAYYRSKYPQGGVEKGMPVFRDNTTSPMVHFLPAYMKGKDITDSDLEFLTNGACNNTSESYINGQRLVEKDITCQNGYVQVLENVMEPLTNMAEAIHNDTSLTIFSKMLDRFSVPVYDENLSNTLGVDSAFIWRYLNNGFDSQLTNYLNTYRGTTFDDGQILSYDPGWNMYANASSNTPAAEDMAVIIAPTDDAFQRYFYGGGGGGEALIDRYGEIDSIPNHIIVNMLDNFMKYSLVATVPSKFSSVMNTAQMEMHLSVGEPGGTTGIGSCLMANNGVVYKSNEVYNIPEYQSVSFPAALDDSIRVMRFIIDELDYQAYLNSMESEFLFILPTDRALRNYVDPVDYHKTTPTITEFYYDDSPQLSGYRIKCRRYNAVRNADGTLSKGEQITNPWTNNSNEQDYVQNRLRDILENSIIVKDKSVSTTSDKSVWVTKGGCPVILEGSAENIRITTPYRKELGEQNNTPATELGVRAVEGYYNMGSNPNGNGETFIVDSEPVMTASKSVVALLRELSAKNPEYSEFYSMLGHSSLAGILYNITSSSTSTTTTARTISNDTTLSVMENYNYTIYVPRTSEINKLYEANIVPDWREILELEDQLSIAEDEGNEPEIARLETQIAEMDSLLNNFIRYHIQNSAIYMSSPASSGTYETSYMGGSRFATLTVNNNGQSGEGSITITCNDSQRQEIENEAPRKVLEGNYLAREYRFRSGNSGQDASNSSPNCNNIENATRIFNSSYAVVHLIDKPLLYTKEMSDAYNAISGN